MTTKKIKTSDILGDNYYIYELTSSNYTPALNDTITITCICKEVYGDTVMGKILTLYQNGESKGPRTTDSNGVVTWSITCSSAGLQKFNIKDTSIEVFIDNKSDIGHDHELYEEKELEQIIRTPYTSDEYSYYDETLQEDKYYTVNRYIDEHTSSFEFSIENFDDITGEDKFIALESDNNIIIIIKEMNNNEVWLYTINQDEGFYGTSTLGDECNYWEVFDKEITISEPQTGISKDATIKVNVNYNRAIFYVYENNILSDTITIHLNDDDYDYGFYNYVMSLNYTGFTIKNNIKYYEPKILSTRNNYGDTIYYSDLGEFGKAVFNVSFNSNEHYFIIDNLCDIYYSDGYIYDNDTTDSENNPMPIKQGNEIVVETIIDGVNGGIIVNLTEGFIHRKRYYDNTVYYGSYESLTVNCIIDEVGIRARRWDIDNLNNNLSYKEDKNNKITSWSGTPSDTKYPSEKLVKQGLNSTLKLSDLYFYYDEETDEIVLSTNPPQSDIIFKDGGVLSSYNDNYVDLNGTINTNVDVIGTTITCSTYSDCFRKANVPLIDDFEIIYNITNINAFGASALLDKNNSMINYYECDGSNLSRKDGDIGNVTFNQNGNNYFKITRVNDTVTYYYNDVEKYSFTTTEPLLYFAWKTHRMNSRSFTFNSLEIKDISKIIFYDKSSSIGLNNYGEVISLEDQTNSTIEYDSTMEAYKLTSKSSGVKAFPITALNGLERMTLTADLYLSSNNGSGSGISLEMVTTQHDGVGYVIERNVGNIERHRFTNNSWITNENSGIQGLKDEWIKMRLDINQNDTTFRAYKSDGTQLNSSSTYQLSNTSSNFNTYSNRRYCLGIGWSNGAVGYVKNIKAEKLKILEEDGKTNNVSTLFGTPISLRNSGTATATYEDNYYVLTCTHYNSDTFIPFTEMQGITDSFKVIMKSNTYDTSHEAPIALYYYLDDDNWGGLNFYSKSGWISNKTNGTFTEQEWTLSGKGKNTDTTIKKFVYDSTNNKLSLSIYDLNKNLIESKSMTIPVTLTSSVKWGTSVCWTNNDKHKLHYIKANYI